jgi:hypothetical protein
VTGGGGGVSKQFSTKLKAKFSKCEQMRSNFIYDCINIYIITTFDGNASKIADTNGIHNFPDYVEGGEGFKQPLCRQHS